MVALWVMMFRPRRPKHRRIDDLDVPLRNLIHTLVAATKDVVLYAVAPERVRSSVLRRHQQRIEKRSVVVAVIHVAVIRLDVSAAERHQAIDVVRVPVAEVFDLRMPALDLAENALLMRSVLKEAHRRAPRLWPSLDDAGDMQSELAGVFLESADNPTARLVLVEPIALVEDGLQRSLRHDEAHVVGRVKFHWESPFPQMRHPR